MCRAPRLTLNTSPLHPLPPRFCRYSTGEGLVSVLRAESTPQELPEPGQMMGEQGQQGRQGTAAQQAGEPPKCLALPGPPAQEAGAGASPRAAAGAAGLQLPGAASGALSSKGSGALSVADSAFDGTAPAVFVAGGSPSAARPAPAAASGAAAAALVRRKGRLLGNAGGGGSGGGGGGGGSGGGSPAPLSAFAVAQGPAFEQ